MTILKTTLAVATATFVLVGCSSSAPKKNADDEFVQVCEYEAGVRAPSWYCNPDIDGAIAAVGEARPNAARDNNLQRTMATANARDALARQLETKVQNMLTNWQRATGTGEGQAYDANFENVSRQVSKQTLSGSRQLNRWVAPDGTLILLVGITEVDPVKAGILSSLKNEQALWQQFQSQKALDELDKQMNATFK